MESKSFEDEEARPCVGFYNDVDVLTVKRIVLAGLLFYHSTVVFHSDRSEGVDLVFYNSSSDRCSDTGTL